MMTNIFKWVAIPVVLMLSVLSGLAGGYEPLMNGLVCMSAILLLQRAALRHQYISRAAGFIAIAVVFAPFFLVVKILLLMSLACVASLSAVLAGFRMQPSPAVCLVA